MMFNLFVSDKLSHMAKKGLQIFPILSKQFTSGITLQSAEKKLFIVLLCDWVEVN